MNSRQYNLLLHPFFLLNLLLLLLNDFLFKYEFHNWLTGKLSDFSGLFVFAVFFIVLFPSSKKLVIILVALFFWWWKSEWSTPLILLLNNRLNIPVQRVIDYTDLYALFVLPLSLYLKPIKEGKTVLRKCVAGIIGFVSFTAFTATSLPRRLTDTNKVLLDKYVKSRKDQKAIIQTLEEQGLQPKPDTIYEKMWNDNYYLKAKDSTGAMLAANKFYDGVYTKIDYGSTYTIPRMYINGDSINNLQLVISDHSPTKKLIRLYSFEYPAVNRDSTYRTFSAYYAWKKFKKPIKKKFKEMLNK